MLNDSASRSVGSVGLWMLLVLDTVVPGCCWFQIWLNLERIAKNRSCTTAAQRAAEST
jgi:hypothetical protein